MNRDDQPDVEMFPTPRPLGALLHEYWRLAEAQPGKSAAELMAAAEAAAAQDEAA